MENKWSANAFALSPSVLCHMPICHCVRVLANGRAAAFLFLSLNSRLRSRCCCQEKKISKSNNNNLINLIFSDRNVTKVDSMSHIEIKEVLMLNNILY